MKVIKLSDKNFKKFKKFTEEWINERNNLLDHYGHDTDFLNKYSDHIMFEVYKKVRSIKDD